MRSPIGVLASLALVFAVGSALSLRGVSDDGPRSDNDWWRDQVFYQIYVPSFKDSDGDGIGDLKGITANVDYLHDLGVGVVILSSDIVNKTLLTEVNSTLGTMDDFKNLTKAFNDTGIKVILDYDPNYTIVEHPWFQNSVKKSKNYTDYYVWMSVPTSNWLCVDSNESAWNNASGRNDKYLSQFGANYPDLNYNNLDVVNEIKQVLTSWLSNGVNGFRMKRISYLLENNNFENEIKIADCNETVYKCLIHNQTTNQAGTYEIVNQLRKHITDQSNSSILIVEPYDQFDEYNVSTAYYANGAGAHLVTNDIGTRFSKSTTSDDLIAELTNWMKAMGSENQSVWMVGSEKTERVASRLGEDQVDSGNMLAALLPGVYLPYYGEELGMADIDGTTEPLGPFQWEDGLNALFTNGTPWKPVNPDYWKVNVKSEKDDERSHLSVFKRLVALRKDLASASLNIYKISNYSVAYVRRTVNDWFVVLMNLDNEQESMNLKVSIPELPGSLNVHTPSMNTALKIGDKVDTSQNLTIRPQAAVVLTTLPISGATLSQLSIPLLIAAIASLKFIF